MTPYDDILAVVDELGDVEGRLRISAATFADHASTSQHVQSMADERAARANSVRAAIVYLKRLAQISRLAESRAGAMSMRQLRAIINGGH